jgi:DNA-binding MarR family transcriptional regulator
LDRRGEPPSWWWSSLTLGSVPDQGPMGQRELGETMGTDPSILVTMLKPLEESGFVTRRRDTADRRRHIVLLTPQEGSS